MIKKFLIFTFSIVLLVTKINAKSFYINNNGLEFSEEEYNFITKMYYDGYQDFISKDDLLKIKNSGVLNGVYERKILNNNSPKSLNYGGRILSMAKSCASTCLVTLNATWTISPSVKSYDVLGFRTSGVSISSTNNANVTGTGYVNSYSSNKSSTNGRGYSIKFPSVNNVIVTASIYTSTGGTVYGSYQHAKSNISLANSKLYNFSSSGSGGIFAFYGAALGKYDEVAGLDISV